MPNDHEARARTIKVARLALKVPTGGTAEENQAIANFFEKLTASDRRVFAAAVGVKAPSDKTWSQLVEVLRRRETVEQACNRSEASQ